MDNYARPFQNGTTTDFSSLASGNPCMYRIAVFAKTLDFTVSQSASFTISAVPFSKSNRSSPHLPSFLHNCADIQLSHYVPDAFSHCQSMGAYFHFHLIYPAPAHFRKCVRYIALSFIQACDKIAGMKLI